MARDTLKEQQDKNGEQIVHQFLCENFYNSATNYTYCNSKYEQFRGIDTKFTYNGLDFLCDEKAALDYVNKDYPLTTFCLELSFLNRNDELMEGWFTDTNKINNSYLFVWVDKATKDIITSADDITDAEIMLVTKDDIKDYLGNLGWTQDKLRIKCDRIRTNENEKLGDYKDNGCKFSYAQNYPEKPINILIKRYEYRKMPHTIHKRIKKN